MTRCRTVSLTTLPFFRGAKRWRFVSIWSLLLKLTPLAFAQELDFPPPPSSQPVAKEEALFQDIPSVHGASKYEQKVTEAPSSVTIVTADEIKKHGDRTLADVLQRVNGFFITNDRIYSYAGVRGFNRPGDFNTRLLILVDGHRINDNLYESGYSGTEAPLDLDLVDRVEIIRGPSSSLYGTNAFFGVINVLTKRGRDLKGVELSTEIGSYESYKGRFSYGNKFSNGLETLFSGSFYDTSGRGRLFFKEFNTPATNNGVARNADGNRTYHLFSKSSFANFTLQGSYSYRHKMAPTAPFETVFNTTRTAFHDEHGYVDLTSEHELPWQWKLSSHLYYDRYYFRGDFLFNYSLTDVPSFVLNQDSAYGEWWGGEVKLERRFWTRHYLTVGVDYRDNVTQRLRNYDVQPFTSYINVNRSSRLWAFYVQDEITLLDNLLLNLGARYDHYDSFGGTFNPRLALIYNLKHTSFKVLYGEAFRAPSLFEQFYAGPVLYKANPHLQPEAITTYELVVEQELGAHLRATAAGYYYTIDGLITQITDPSDNLLVYKNSEMVNTKGLELGLDGR
jgi:iron complex outermembrane receptor protein